MTTVPYAMSTPESMAKAADEIKASGRKAIGIKCDVRQASYVDAMVNKVMETFGKIEKEIRKNEPDTDEKNLKSLARLRK
jgi:NAD(P)-dependent dehydrogenase (short-subunit alcohol dehydrogenase family)